MIKPGTTIAIDGVDGSGKSTQVQLLTQHLESAGFSVYTTRAVGGTPIGENLRSIMLSDTPRSVETDFYIARAMYAELTHYLNTHRSAGNVIIIDRSPMSFWAYQVHGDGLPREVARPAIEDILREWQIDYLLMLDVPPDKTISRRNQRSVHDHFENMDSGYHQKVYTGYREAIEIFHPVVIDATGTIDEVQQQILDVVEAQAS